MRMLYTAEGAEHEHEAVYLLVSHQWSRPLGSDQNNENELPPKGGWALKGRVRSSKNSRYSPILKSAS